MSLINRVIRGLVGVSLVGIAGTSSAALVFYSAPLSGAAEAPPNASPGTGVATLLVDTAALTMTLDVIFSGLLGTVTASHIHCCTAVPDTGTAGVATQTPTFSGFPLGVTAGTYHQVFDMTLPSTWNAAFVTANGGSALLAADAFMAGLDAERAYLNIHTSLVPSGEIRGFLIRDVPEPAMAGLLGLAAVGLAWSKRR